MRKRDKELRKDPEYRKKKREYYKRWYLKPENYKRFKDYMRVYMRKRMGYNARVVN